MMGNFKILAKALPAVYSAHHDLLKANALKLLIRTKNVTIKHLSCTWEANNKRVMETTDWFLYKVSAQPPSRL